MKAYRKEIFKSRFQEHYPRLCCIACGYVSDKEDAEDIVQELFISVWNKGLDEMEEKGIVGPFQGSKPRAILITKEQWASMKGGQTEQMGFDDLDSVPDELM